MPEPPPPAAGKQGADYLTQVYPRFREPWHAFVNDCRLRLPAGDPLNDSTLRAVVSFGVRADGATRDIAVTSSSSNKDFDEVALEIVKDAGKLPAPPEALAGDDGLVTVRWAFQRDQRLAGVATVEIEKVRWPPEKAVPAFVEAGLVRRAAERLGEVSDTRLARLVAVAAVAAALASEDDAVKAAGVDAAAMSGASELGPGLESAARTAVDVGVRRRAIRALGTVRAVRSKPFLLSLVSGGEGASDASMTAAAAHALEDIGAAGPASEALLAAVRGTDEQRRLALAVMSDVAVPAAVADLQKLVSGGESRAIRAAACSALGRAAGNSPDRDAAVTTMRKALSTNDAAVRAACVRGIKLLAAAGAQSRATYWKAVELLKDRDDAVRAAAANAAAHLDPDRFGGELYVLRKERSPTVLAALARGLAVVKGPVAYQRLVGLAKHESVDVRRAAAQSLAKRPEQQANQVLSEMVGDSDVEIKLAAIGAVESVGALQAYADSEQLRVRLAVLSRIAKARGQSDATSDMAAGIAASDSAINRAALAAAWLSATP